MMTHHRRCRQHCHIVVLWLRCPHRRVIMSLCRHSIVFRSEQAGRGGDERQVRYRWLRSRTDSGVDERSRSMKHGRAGR